MPPTSLLTWFPFCRLQARVERMEQFQKEKEELDKGCRECKRKLAECQKKMKELEVTDPESGKGELEKLQAEAQQLKNEEKSWENKLEELKKKEKNMPWNVDTLSKDGFSKVGLGELSLPVCLCHPCKVAGLAAHVLLLPRVSSTSSRRRRRKRRNRKRRNTKPSWRDMRSRSNTSVSAREGFGGAGTPFLRMGSLRPSSQGTPLSRLPAAGSSWEVVRSGEQLTI